MTASFKDNRKEFDKRIALLEQLGNSYVLIGFQTGEVTYSQVKNNIRKKPGMVMAQIAAANEFGTNHIPARPFMRTSFDENRQRINNIIANEYDKILAGTSTIKRSLDLIGLFGTDLIQQKIRAIYVPPNAPSTIARKKSSKPLIDFGQMIQSVRHKTVIQ